MRFYSIALTSNFENTPLLHNAPYKMKLHSISKYIVKFKGLKSWKKKSFRFIGSKRKLIAIENLIIFFPITFYHTPETKSFYIFKNLIRLKKALNKYMCICIILSPTKSTNKFIIWLIWEEVYTDIQTYIYIFFTI